MFNKHPKKLAPREVESRIKTGGASFVIDVRETDEWTAGHIPGIRHIPLSQLPIRLKELHPGSEYILLCQSGGRSARACGYLNQRGYRALDMAGGMSAWTGQVTYGR